MFVLSFYEASRKSAPAKAGFYEGDRAPNIDIHLKWAGIDKTGWALSGLPAARPGRPFQRRRLLLTSVRQFDNH